MFQMMGVFAEFERSMMRERVNAGLRRAKDAGKTLGRRRLEDDKDKVQRVVAKAVRADLQEGGVGIRMLAARDGVGVAPSLGSKPTFKRVKLVDTIKALRPIHRAALGEIRCSRAHLPDHFARFYGRRASVLGGDGRAAGAGGQIENVSQTDVPGLLATLRCPSDDTRASRNSYALSVFA